MRKSAEINGDVTCDYTMSALHCTAVQLTC